MSRPGKGLKHGVCPRCPRKKFERNFTYMRAVYIRKPEVGFKRIGWLYLDCGHVELDQKESKVDTR